MASSDIYLRHFQKNEINLNPNDARKVLVFFFSNNVVPVEQLSDSDVEFAQALLLEAIDKSYAMGYVHAIYDAFYGKIPGDADAVKDMLKDFVKAAARNWFDHATGKDLNDPKIYSSVRAMIAANFRSVWTIRMQTGEAVTY
jgi:hypothetical protein